MMISRSQTASLLRVRAALALATMVAASIVLAPAAVARVRSCAGARTPIAAASRARLQRTVVCLIDRQRSDRGLPALRESSRLNRSAQGWTNVMVDDRLFSHGADFASRISAVGFHWSSAGENIATGFGTPAAVVRAWMASTGHCQNILNPSFRDVGTGVSDRAISGFASQGGTWTQDFGLWMGRPAASHDWGPADGCPYG